MEIPFGPRGGYCRLVRLWPESAADAYLTQRVCRMAASYGERVFVRDESHGQFVDLRIGLRNGGRLAVRRRHREERPIPVRVQRRTFRVIRGLTLVRRGWPYGLRRIRAGEELARGGRCLADGH